MSEFLSPLRGLVGFDVLPAVETAGYFRSSPRDFYGARRSRWGWWSRFQRLKAASLVSAKRNGSVGDSTWPSQNTTLALPSQEWREKSFHGNRKIRGNIVAPYLIPRRESFLIERWLVEIQLIETVNHISSGFVEREPFFQVDLIFKNFARIKRDKTT